MRNARAVFPMVVLILALVAAPARCDGPAVSAGPWPEADRLFRSGHSWLGGDGAASVDLGDGRILWMFGDSFISPGPGRSRHQAGVVRNSVAVQSGYDPTAASITFHYGGTAEDPEAYFRTGTANWYWPVSGAMAEGSLVVFLMDVKIHRGDLGFMVESWMAMVCKEPRGPPEKWRWRRADLAGHPRSIVPGAALLVEGGHLYAFGVAKQGSHPVYLCRWREADAAEGRLAEPEWWRGSQKGWMGPGAPDSPPAALFENGQAEFTVHSLEQGGYMQIQSLGFGPARLGARFASEITGPWSMPEVFYSPPERRHADVLVYAAKAHPELSGADLVVTYMANTLNWNALLADQTLYYPRFLKVSLGKNGGKRPGPVTRSPGPPVPGECRTPGPDRRDRCGPRTSACPDCPISWPPACHCTPPS